jgi:hypothetical protein
LAGSLKTVSKELSKNKLDLTGIQKVRCGRDGNEPAGEHTFFLERGMGIMNWVLFCAKQSHQQLRGLSLLMIRCHIYNTHTGKLLV